MTTTARTPRCDDPIDAIPAGYYAVPDPDQPQTMTYWHRQRTGRAMATWPAKARYGPVARRSDVPTDPEARRAFAMDYSARISAWMDRALDAIAADPAACAARFAELTTRCLCCGRKLTDAKSKLLGIGPDCRRRARLDDGVLCAHMTPRIAAAHAAHVAEEDGAQ